MAPFSASATASIEVDWSPGLFQLASLPHSHFDTLSQKIQLAEFASKYCPAAYIQII
jgi:hypothetical protein